MEPDLRLLRYFVAVADEMHFGRAAARLFISQPTLSHQIRRLETTLGAELFVRDRRRVELTPVGEALVESARRVIGGMEQFTAEAERARRQVGERLCLGFQARVPDSGLVKVLEAFRRTHPHVRLEFQQFDFNDTSVGLNSGASDVALVPMPMMHNLHVRPLWDEQVVVLISDRHELARRSEVTIAELVASRLSWGQPPDADPAYRDFWTAAEHRARLGDRGRVNVMTPLTIESLAVQVASGTLLCLTFERFLEVYPFDGLATIPVRDAPRVGFSVGRRPDDRRPLVADLVATVANVLAVTSTSTMPSALVPPQQAGDAPDRVPQMLRRT